MTTDSLKGRTILIVEDEPLIVMGITMALEHTGVGLTITTTLKHALLLVEHDGLSCAILDHALGDGDATPLYARLQERGVPFLIYSGYSQIKGVGPDVPHLVKPVSNATLVALVERLALGVRPGPHQTAA